MFPTFVRNTWTSTQTPPDSYMHVVGMASVPQASLSCEIPVSLSRLVDLLEENGEDDYGMIGPTQFAFKTAFRMVQKAEKLAGGEFSSSPSVDSEGGIRITWRRGERQIKLICPSTPNAPTYIYQSSPEGSALRNQNVTVTVLADKLAWLANCEPSTARASG
jgi:hypothetical protein